MTKRKGTLHNDELWLRCPFCGDSEKDPNKAHFSINANGMYYCLRCHTGGHLSHREFLEVLSVCPDLGEAQLSDRTELAYIIEHLIPGPGSTRKSLLERYHYDKYDAFLSRDQTGRTLGVALVSKEDRKIIGKRGLGYSSYLASSPENPLRLVEGPYDVLYENDVCLFGLPTIRSLRLLRGHWVILCPDGDVWTSRTKTKVMLQVIRFIEAQSSVILRGIEWLPPGKDPDDIPREKRKLYSLKEIFGDATKRLRTGRSRRKWEEYLSRMAKGEEESAHNGSTLGREASSKALREFGW